MTYTPEEYLGTDCVLSYSTDGTTYVDIDHLISIDGPEMTYGTVDTPGLGKDSKTCRTTVPDGGEINAQVYLDIQSTTHTELLSLMKTKANSGGVLMYWKLTYSDLGAGTGATASSSTWQGYLTKLKPGGMEMETMLVADLTIKTSGVITTTAGTPGT